MNVNKKNRKEFRIRILRDQLKTCWNQFHETAQKWLKEVKSQNNNSVSAETSSKHPNQLINDLKQINYQRAYIEFKIQMAEKDKKLPLPMELKQKMEKAELSVEFHKEFPTEYSEFIQQLKQKLTSKPYRPVQKAQKPKPSKINIPWRLTITDNPDMAKKKPYKKLSPSVSTLIRAIHGHGKLFRDHHGYFQPPMFTKARVEKTFAIYIPNPKFQKLKKRLNSMEKRKKLGRAKAIKRWRKGNTNYKNISIYKTYAFRGTIRRK